MTEQSGVTADQGDQPAAHLAGVVEDTSMCATYGE